MVFLTLIVRPLSREPEHGLHKQRVNKTFVFRNYKYALRGGCNPPHVDCLPANILLPKPQAYLADTVGGGTAII